MDQPQNGERVGGRTEHALAAGKTKAHRARSLKSGLAALAGALALSACTPPPAGGDPGGPFHMVDQDGHATDQSVLNGHWSAVFFGYTYCPDVCPATLQTLGRTAKQLGDKAKTLQVVFVSVDPDRDTPKVMKAYLDAQVLPVRTVGLTGTPAEVAAAAKAYKVYYAKAGTGREYAVDHSAAIYLMNPQGRFVTLLNPAASSDDLAKSIAKAEAG